MELFNQIVSAGGEGLSHSVRLEATWSRQLLSATINGQPIDATRDYRIATIDYLLGGNDKMLAFKKGRDISSPQEVSDNTRFIIVRYFREQTRLGKVVDAEIEGRIIVKKDTPK